MIEADESPASSSPQHERASAMKFLLWLEGFIERMFIWFSLYALSIGPMYWEWARAKYLSGSSLLAALYEPLLILAGLFPPLGEWLNWYVRWWTL